MAATLSRSAADFGRQQDIKRRRRDYGNIRGDMIAARPDRQRRYR
jgi:hypothetical protein